MGVIGNGLGAFEGPTLGSTISGFDYCDDKVAVVDVDLG